MEKRGKNELTIRLYKTNPFGMVDLDHFFGEMLMQVNVYSDHESADTNEESNYYTKHIGKYDIQMCGQSFFFTKKSMKNISKLLLLIKSAIVDDPDQKKEI